MRLFSLEISAIIGPNDRPFVSEYKTCRKKNRKKGHLWIQCFHLLRVASNVVHSGISEYQEPLATFKIYSSLYLLVLYGNGVPKHGLIKYGVEKGSLAVSNLELRRGLRPLLHFSLRSTGLINYGAEEGAPLLHFSLRSTGQTYVWLC